MIEKHKNRYYSAAPQIHYSNILVIQDRTDFYDTKKKELYELMSTTKTNFNHMEYRENKKILNFWDDPVIPKIHQYSQIKKETNKSKSYIPYIFSKPTKLNNNKSNDMESDFYKRHLNKFNNMFFKDTNTTKNIKLNFYGLNGFDEIKTQIPNSRISLSMSAFYSDHSKKKKFKNFY